MNNHPRTYSIWIGMSFALFLSTLLLLQTTTYGFSLISSTHRQQQNPQIVTLSSNELLIQRVTLNGQSRFINRRLSAIALPELQLVIAEDSVETNLDSTTTTNILPLPTKAWSDDGFVFGLQGSGLERPKGKASLLVIDGDTLETQPYQQAMVGMTFIAHAFFLSSSFFGLLSQHSGNLGTSILHSIALLISSWIIADFGSGVLHWSVDNYGNGKTPIMGSIIAAFQGHHTAPWTITQREFCNNVYKLCIPFGIIPMTLISILFNSSPAIIMFVTFFCIFEILSQEFHKWSHQLISETPAWVNKLQKFQLTVGRKQHAQHHLAPFEGNYCIISGACNNILDSIGFFRRLEHLIYNVNGVESNAWKLDASLRARTLRGDYSIPK
jgi:palmitoyl-[glycerolipid] 3-(E)-desaturase